MLERLRRMFRGVSGETGSRPLLVRVRSANGGFIEGLVGLRATWSSGKTVTRTSRAEQGLCIIPWIGDGPVELHVSHESGAATVAVAPGDAESGCARLVVLS